MKTSLPRRHTVLPSFVLILQRTAFRGGGGALLEVVCGNRVVLDQQFLAVESRTEMAEVGPATGPENDFALPRTPRRPSITE
jgi:hypothetical protein